MAIVEGYCVLYLTEFVFEKIEIMAEATVVNVLADIEENGVEEKTLNEKQTKDKITEDQVKENGDQTEDTGDQKVVCRM